MLLSSNPPSCLIMNFSVYDTATASVSDVRLCVRGALYVVILTGDPEPVDNQPVWDTGAYDRADDRRFPGV
jgi:hypothetical protein